MTFRVGQKVVCIKDTWIHRNWQLVRNKPIAGGIYTIRGISDWWHDGEAAFVLEEIVNPARAWVNEISEPHFWAARFRPLVDTKSEISFTQGAPKDSKRFDNRRKIKERA